MGSKSAFVDFCMCLKGWSLAASIFHTLCCQGPGMFIAANINVLVGNPCDYFYGLNVSMEYKFLPKMLKNVPQSGLSKLGAYLLRRDLELVCVFITE